MPLFDVHLKANSQSQFPHLIQTGSLVSVGLGLGMLLPLAWQFFNLCIPKRRSRSAGSEAEGQGGCWEL